MTGLDRAAAARTILRQTINQAGVTARELDRKLGWYPGQVGRLLNGFKRLTLEELDDLLSALGVAPEDFFALLYQADARRKEDLNIGALAAIEPAPGLAGPAAAGEAPMGREEILRLVEDTVARLLGTPSSSPR